MSDTTQAIRTPFEQWQKDTGQFSTQPAGTAEEAWDAATLVERERCYRIARDTEPRMIGGVATRVRLAIMKAIREVKP
jgi:hypothetical protein